MPSIVSSCLILLKLAMAVNDGLHTMLSNVYNVIENAMQNACSGQSVQESSSAPGFHRSKPQIIEAFNRRRANLVIYDQTDVLVSNLTPFQEITITNKDVEGKRKQTVSPIKRSSCKRTITRCNRDVESNGETPFPEKSSLSNSQSRSPSPVSSETTHDSEDQTSCRVDNFTVEGETENLCEDNSMDEPVVDAAGIPNDFSTSRNVSASSTSLVSQSNKSPITKSGFLKYLQGNNPLTSQPIFRASSNCSNKQSPKNVWGSTDSDSDSTDNIENMTKEIQSNSAKISPEEAISNFFSSKVAKMCEDFLQSYFPGNYASANLKTKGSDKNLNGNLPAFEDDFTQMGMTSPNSQAPRTNSDGPLIGFGYFSDDKPISRVSTAKHINTSEVPLLLKKDRWTNMDELNPRCLQELDETSSKSEESDLECSTDYYFQPEDELLPSLSNSFETGTDSMKPNSSRPRLVCEELDDSYDLEVIGLARVDGLTKVLKEVGSTEVLDKPENFKEDVSNLLNEISNTIRKLGFSSAVETNSASASHKKIPNLSNIPLTDLDTEEKKINYLNNLTDICREEMESESKREDIFSVYDVPFEEFKLCHKVMLETATNVCKNDFGFITQSTDMHINQLPSTDTGLKMKFDIQFNEREATNEDRYNICVSSQPSSKVEELDVFGLPFFVQNESKVKNTEHIPNINASFEMHSEAVSEDDLCDGDKDHSESSFSDYFPNNETSTPISNEMLDKQNWESINLSVESRKEFDTVVSDDDKSFLSYKKRQNSTFNEKDEIPSLIDIGMENELVYSPNERNAITLEEMTLEAKDWGKLASEISINYSKCIEVLNMCDDEAEDANMKAKSNCSADVCKGKSDAEKTEPLGESKDLVKSNSCNDALPLESNETTNSNCPTTNCENISSSGLKYEEQSPCKDKELDCSSSSDSSSDSDSSDNSSSDSDSSDNSSSSHNESNFGVSVIEKCYPESEKSNEKADVQINDYTHLEMFPREENASCSKEISQNLSSDDVIVEQLLSSTHTVFVKRTSNELTMKPNLGNTIFLNKEFLAYNFDMNVEFYLKFVESKNEKSGKDSIESADYLNREFYFEDRNINSCPISKQFMGETRSYLKSTPISNIEALQRREELETSRIYDNEIYDHETLIATHSDSDLPPSDNQIDSNDVPMLNSNENRTLIQISNTKKAGNDLIIFVDGTKEVIDVTNCEKSIEKDLACEILN